MERGYGLEVPQTLEEACHPQRLALIVYDMQVGILRQLKNGAAIKATVGEVLQAESSWESSSSAWRWRGSESRRSRPWSRGSCAEAIFDKITMSAFEGTPLDIALRDCGVNAFVLVGVATEIGIEPTVRHGTDLGYIPIVVADACGAGHEEAGARSLESLRYIGDAIVTDVAQICGVLRRKARSRRA